MCVNVFILFEVTLPLSNLLEIWLLKGSVLCMFLRVSFQSSVICGGVFTLPLVDVVVVSAVVISAVLLCFATGAASRTIWGRCNCILINAVAVAGVSLTSTNDERQSAFLQAPDIH